MIDKVAVAPTELGDALTALTALAAAVLAIGHRLGRVAPTWLGACPQPCTENLSHWAEPVTSFKLLK